MKFPRYYGRFQKAHKMLLEKPQKNSPDTEWLRNLLNDTVPSSLFWDCSVKRKQFGYTGEKMMSLRFLQGPLLSKCLLGNKWLPMLKKTPVKQRRQIFNRRNKSSCNMSSSSKSVKASHHYENNTWNLLCYSRGYHYKMKSSHLSIFMFSPPRRVNCLHNILVSVSNCHTKISIPGGRVQDTGHICNIGQHITDPDLFRLLLFHMGRSLIRAV